MKPPAQQHHGLYKKTHTHEAAENNTMSTHVHYHVAHLRCWSNTYCKIPNKHTPTHTARRENFDASQLQATATLGTRTSQVNDDAYLSLFGGSPQVRRADKPGVLQQLLAGFRGRLRAVHVQRGGCHLKKCMRRLGSRRCCISVTLNVHDTVHVTLGF